MEFRLYPYQEKAVDAILSDPCHTQLISMPTGTGKTITFLSVAKKLGKKCLVLVHREELLQQTLEKARFLGFSDSEVSIVSSSKKEPLKTLSVAMVQTLSRNLDIYTEDCIEMIIVDEAHHSTANSYKDIFKFFKIFENKKLLLGFTATPLRGDKDCLSSIYQSHSFKMTLSEATQNGYICPVHGLRVIIDKSLESIENTQGDYKIDDLDHVMNCDSINSLVAERCQHLSRVPAIVFCTSVDHAEKICERLKGFGRKAACVSYLTHKKDLEATLASLKKGELEFITNAVKLSEGFDFPPIQTIVSVRPTRSPVLYKQMIGRGLRRSENKFDCFVMEFCGNDPKMMCWDDIDQNATFQSFTESQKTDRKDALTFYKNRFGNPQIKILDVRVSPFHFYECNIRRICKYKNFFYSAFTHGFSIGEMRSDGFGPEGQGGKLLYGYTCFWKKEFKTFYVWDGGGLMANDHKSDIFRVGNVLYAHCHTEEDLKRNFLFFLDHPAHQGNYSKWYPSEQEPMTGRQKSFLKNPEKMSARKAEMFIEDCAIKQAIKKYWIDQKMPDVDGGDVDSGKIVARVYDLEEKY